MADWRAPYLSYGKEGHAAYYHEPLMGGDGGQKWTTHWEYACVNYDSTCRGKAIS